MAWRGLVEEPGNGLRVLSLRVMGLRVTGLRVSGLWVLGHSPRRETRTDVSQFSFAGFE